MLDLFIILLRNIGIISVMAIIITRISTFRTSILNQNATWNYKLFLIAFFGLVGIYGTYAGVAVDDAVANSRVIGPFVGGLVGGPFVGLFSGLIAGIHRYAINPEGFSSLACVIITPLQGLIIGLLSSRILSSKHPWLPTLLSAMAAETIHMGMVLILSRPFPQALSLVKLIGPPMIIANSIGITSFILVIESVMKDRQIAATHHAQRVLEIAKETLIHLRKGLNTESTTQAAEIILARSHLDAVSFTDTQKVLCHVGIGNEFHPIGDPIQTTITRQVIDSGEYQIGPHIHADGAPCPIHSAVVVPIKIQGKMMGTFKMYKQEENGITPLDIQLALGLTNLFSQQLELELVEKQFKLMKEAEYHALQSQINPHFLFNALNTISSVIRSSSEKGRELLLSLAEYLRGNLNFAHEISLRQEIQHVQAYLAIEMARFGDKLRVEFDIPADCNLTLPPFTLQPLIENAIKHGVRSRKEGGTVWVKIKEEKNLYQIEVSDNGKGVGPKKAATLLIPNEKSDSVGLINIHHRLIARYGEQSGLCIESQEDQGTQVSFFIPKGQ